MGLVIGDNFDYKAAKPLDARLKYDTLAAMKAVADSTMYEGCEAYCAETDKYYKFLSTNTVDADTGKWREREDSAGHIIEDSEGTALTQRDTLQFSDSFSVSDDSDTKKTKVELDKLTSGEMGDIMTPLPSYSGGNSNPTGTIIHFMGNYAPDGYLACDGSTKNIADYPRLANFFLVQFGSINHFGGDGTTTFAVPDLRGEFLRGTGSNSHSNGGNGSAVGAHQDPTYHPAVGVGNGTSASKGYLVSFVSDNDTAYNNTVYLQDKNLTRLLSGETPDAQPITKYTYASTSTATTGATNAGYASRPTNTSVLLCIKD